VFIIGSSFVSIIPMSRAATSCAGVQRGLKPATKIALWRPSDRQNPGNGCFPTQARLDGDAEMFIKALDDHLATPKRRGQMAWMIFASVLEREAVRPICDGRLRTPPWMQAETRTSSGMS
jgi:hypothetical protein